jgi:hypothetical protein
LPSFTETGKAMAVFSMEASVLLEAFPRSLL